MQPIGRVSQIRMLSSAASCCVSCHQFFVVRRNLKTTIQALMSDHGGIFGDDVDQPMTITSPSHTQLNAAHWIIPCVECQTESWSSSSNLWQKKPREVKNSKVMTGEWGVAEAWDMSAAITWSNLRLWHTGDRQTDGNSSCESWKRYSWMGYPLTPWHRGLLLAAMTAVMVNGLITSDQSSDLPSPLTKYKWKKKFTPTSSYWLLCSSDADAAECCWIDLHGFIIHQ